MGKIWVVYREHSAQERSWVVPKWHSLTVPYEKSREKHTVRLAWAMPILFGRMAWVVPHGKVFNSQTYPNISKFPLIKEKRP